MERQRYRSTLSSAGINIAFEYSHLKTAMRCREYLTKDKEYKVFIKIEDADIALEKSLYNRTDETYTEDYYESRALLRKIAESLIDFDTILMHGAVVSDGKYAYMFTANSGTGKSTHVHKWVENLSSARIINGDKPLVRIIGNAAFACGTPWCGKERENINTMVPLKAIVVMERNEFNQIINCQVSDILPILINQTHRPTGAVELLKTMSVLEQLSDKVSFYKFYFNNMKDDCFQVAYDALHRS